MNETTCGRGTKARFAGCFVVLLTAASGLAGNLWSQTTARGALEVTSSLGESYTRCPMTKLLTTHARSWRPILRMQA